MPAPEHFIAVPICNSGGTVLYTAHLNLLTIATIEPWNTSLAGTQTRIRNQNNKSYRILGDHNVWRELCDAAFGLLEPALILEVMRAMASLRKYER